MRLVYRKVLSEYAIKSVCVEKNVNRIRGSLNIPLSVGGMIKQNKYDVSSGMILVSDYFYAFNKIMSVEFKTRHFNENLLY